MFRPFFPTDADFWPCPTHRCAVEEQGGNSSGWCALPAGHGTCGSTGGHAEARLTFMFGVRTGSWTPAGRFTLAITSAASASCKGGHLLQQAWRGRRGCRAHSLQSRNPVYLRNPLWRYKAGCLHQFQPGAHQALDELNLHLHRHLHRRIRYGGRTQQAGRRGVVQEGCGRGMTYLGFLVLETVPRADFVYLDMARQCPGQERLCGIPRRQRIQI